MILNDKQLLEIFKTRPTKAIWTEAQNQKATLQRHVLGIGLASSAKAIMGHENEAGRKVREKYGKSNRDLYARVLQPTNAIWNARGGGVQYLVSEAQEKQLKTLLSNVRAGYSVRRWIRNFWRPRYIDDPMGLIMMETGTDSVYPTYKSSSDIYEALPNGRGLEYLILKTPDPTIFRVIDDTLDRMVSWTGEGEDMKLKALNAKAYPSYANYFSRVPAIIISDIPKDGRPDFFASPIDFEVELADIFYREGSITSLYRFKFGFPVRWKYPEVCGTCKGQKSVNGQPCVPCNGSGIKLLNDPGDVSVFAWPSKDEPEIKEKGGYTTPDLKFLEYADKAIGELERLITRTHWGTYLQEAPVAPGEKETATGRFIDIQPVENRLADYATAAESIEKFISDMFSVYYFNKDAVTSASLGRRFLIEGAEQIWANVLDARQKGAPLLTIKDLLRDYYETKHQGNQQEQDFYLKLIDLEPGVSLTLKEAKDTLPYLEYMKKVCFDNFTTITGKTAIINTPIKKLMDDLTTYTQAYIQEVAQNPDPNAPVISADPTAAGAPPVPGAPPKKPVNKPIPANA